MVLEALFRCCCLTVVGLLELGLDGEVGHCDGGSGCCC